MSSKRKWKTIHIICLIGKLYFIYITEHTILGFVCNFDDMTIQNTFHKKYAKRCIIYLYVPVERVNNVVFQHEQIRNTFFYRIFMLLQPKQTTRNKVWQKALLNMEVKRTRTFVF